MFSNTLRIVAATIAVLLLITAAEARISTITKFCGDRVCTIEFSFSKPLKTYRVARMRIDKPQQYVKPERATDRLVTRETHEQGSDIVRSKKTGATARVSPRYAHLFQAYIDELEAGGASIYYMGGYRRGRCSSASMHPCGKALDVCQDARDRVSGHKNCHLPGRQELARIAARHGLFEGGQWCHGDMGHAQVGVSAAPCGSNIYSAVRKYKRHQRLARR